MTEVQTPDEGTELKEEVTPQVDPETETPQTPPDEVVETPEAEPTPEQTPSEPQPTPPGYVPKDKFVASAQESILNAERVKVKEAQIESLTKQDTPTDEAMRQLYPAWDQMDEFTKGVLVKQEAQEMNLRRTTLRQQEIDARLKLDEQLDDVVENSEYAPKLQGKEAEFKRFARNPKNKGISADVLAKAFLFDAEEESPPSPNEPESTPKEALPVGSGGPRGDLKPKKVSSEEAKVLRETNYQEWLRLVKAGAIEEPK